MPSKGKQRASRQAQLSNKRRKGRTHVVDSRRESTIQKEDAPLVSEVETAGIEKSVNLSNQGSLAKRTPISSATPGINLKYEYLASEIRQIGIVASVIVALLVAFAFIPLG